jgi:hypothetical protein
MELAGEALRTLKAALLDGKRGYPQTLHRD